MTDTAGGSTGAWIAGQRGLSFGAMPAQQSPEAGFIAHADKSDRAYAPSFGFEGALLTERQGAIHSEVADVDGWIEPDDALKLYELGYLAPGPFLEIGTYRGKSAVVLCSALRDAGRDVEFYSLDIARDDLELARGTLAEWGLAHRVRLVHGSVTALFRALPGFRPRFVFLDGDHSADGLGRDLAVLEPHVPEGALLLFHDYNNLRNQDPQDKEYGVPQAIATSWVASDCEYAGTFGGSGLYRRTRGPEGGGEPGAPSVIELIGLDRPAVRGLIQVARPAKRYLVRRLAQLRRR